MHKMFKMRQAADALEDNLVAYSSEEGWRLWAKAEEQIRLVIAAPCIVCFY